MKRLTKEQVMLLHKELVKESGGSAEIRDEGLLDSALNAPFQTFDDAELYPTIIEKAARLGYSLIKNHAFVDGNKRIGTHTMLVFLSLNHIEVETEAAAWKEQQPKKRFALYTQLREYKTQLEELKHGQAKDAHA